jgi:hypothetical protein
MKSYFDNKNAEGETYKPYFQFNLPNQKAKRPSKRLGHQAIWCGIRAIGACTTIIVNQIRVQLSSVCSLLLLFDSSAGFSSKMAAR